MLSICENRVGFFAQMYIGRSISIGGRTFRYPIWVYSFCASIDSDVGFPFVSRHLVQYDFRAIVTPNILLCPWPGPLLLTQQSRTLRLPLLLHDSPTTLSHFTTSSVLPLPYPHSSFSLCRSRSRLGHAAHLIRTRRKHVFSSASRLPKPSSRAT